MANMDCLDCAQRRDHGPSKMVLMKKGSSGPVPSVTPQKPQPPTQDASRDGSLFVGCAEDRQERGARTAPSLLSTTPATPQDTSSTPNCFGSGSPFTCVEGRRDRVASYAVSEPVIRGLSSSPGPQAAPPRGGSPDPLRASSPFDCIEGRQERVARMVYVKKGPLFPPAPISPPLQTTQAQPHDDASMSSWITHDLYETEKSVLLSDMIPCAFSEEQASESFGSWMSISIASNSNSKDDKRERRSSPADGRRGVPRQYSSIAQQKLDEARATSMQEKFAARVQKYELYCPSAPAAYERRKAESGQGRTQIGEQLVLNKICSNGLSIGMASTTAVQMRAFVSPPSPTCARALRAHVRAS